jgi:hypothetical protein
LEFPNLAVLFSIWLVRMKRNLPPDRCDS